MDDQQRRYLVAGAILVLLGLGLYAMRMTEGWGEALIFFAIGGVFLVAYLARRNFGFLIPGCIMLGIGLGRVGEEIPLGISDFGGVGLGLGFMAITIIHLIYQRQFTWWPLIPGAVLVFGGVLSGSRDVEDWLERHWPLLFVFAGLIVVALAVRPRKKKVKETDPPKGPF